MCLLLLHVTILFSSKYLFHNIFKWYLPVWFTKLLLRAVLLVLRVIIKEVVFISCLPETTMEKTYSSI